MVGLDRHMVSELSLIDGFKDGQSLTHCAYADCLEILCI
jgi:hypothetical protein